MSDTTIQLSTTLTAPLVRSASVSLTGVDWPIMFTALLLLGVLTALLTGWVKRYALRRQLLDHPNERSSHTTPTPRGGGLSLIIGIGAGITWLSTQCLMPSNVNAISLSMVVAIAVISFIDDHKSIAANWRFLVHLLAACIAVGALPLLPPLQFGNLTISSGWLLAPTYIIGLVWLLNLYNFMDGIDGIAATEAILVTLTAAAYFYWQGYYGWLLMCLLVSACNFGFLWWNWAPAKIFMGDIGSASLGFLVGLIALASAAETNVSIWSWLILLAPFIGDSTWTLLTRAITKQRWHQPHRSHAYQRLSDRYNDRHKSHARVCKQLIIFHSLWLAPLSYISILHPTWAIVFCVLAYLPVITVCRITKAGQKTIE